jgi:WXXGXW repeat (2 copies)
MDRCGLRQPEDGVPLAERSKTQVEGNTRTSAKSTVQAVDVRHASARAGRIAAWLAGSLVLILAMLAAPVASSARISVGVRVSFGPPALPYYVQPPCPGPGYIWTPGYWAWDPAYGYYWVPGTWVPAPFVGALWTPGYWDFDDDAYVWFPGYWGLSVGYYGDIDYGYGYTGDGYHGGYWNHGEFYYNRSVNRITTRNFRHVYDRRVDEHFRDRHISFHGGPGGTRGRPTHAELAAARQRRSLAVSQQEHQRLLARADPVERARVNHGRPDVAATPRPGVFEGHGVVRASSAGAPYREPPHGTVRGSRVAHPAPHGNAAPHAQPERGAPARHGMREQPPARSNPPHANRRAPMPAHPPEARQPESRARHAAPAREARHAAPA